MNASTLLRYVLAIVGIGLATMAVWSARSRGTGGGSPPPPGVTTPFAEAAGSPRILAEGRLTTYPGAQVVLSSEVNGVVTNILVAEKSRVQAGELIAEIQADDVYASWEEARARRAEIESETALAALEVKRGRSLAQTGAITPQELDRLEKALDTLQARRTTAEVQVQRLEITRAKTRIRAPFPGVILARHIHAGEVVAAGTPIVTLVDLNRVRVEAEVDEYDAGRVEVGADAVIRAEGYADQWPGRVEEIPDVVVSRTLHPEDPAQPSDVRVLRVKVALTGPCPLKLGQRVELEIRCPQTR